MNWERESMLCCIQLCIRSLFQQERSGMWHRFYLNFFPSSKFVIEILHAKWRIDKRVKNVEHALKKTHKRLLYNCFWTPPCWMVLMRRVSRTTLREIVTVKQFVVPYTVTMLSSQHLLGCWWSKKNKAKEPKAPINSLKWQLTGQFVASKQLASHCVFKIKQN